MQTLPNDIKLSIEKLFTDAEDRKYVTNKLLSLFDTKLNVGAEQLARAILFLANGETKVLDEIFDSHFYGDPRDLLVGAMEKFNEMKKNPEGMPRLYKIDIIRRTKSRRDEITPPFQGFTH